MTNHIYIIFLGPQGCFCSGWTLHYIELTWLFVKFQDFLGPKSDTITKEEFIAFIKKAMDKENAEAADLYYFLCICFWHADEDSSGAVDLEEFDQMIEMAADVPRRFGLAPSSKSMYPTKEARIAARREAFDKMDTNGNGTISIDEWLAYSTEHIMGKVAAL